MQEFRTQQNPVAVAILTSNMGHLLEMEVLMGTIFWTSSILVGGFKHFLFFHISEIVIPTDELILFRGVETTNQIYSNSFFSPRLWFWVYVYVDPQSSEFPGTMHQIIQEVKPRKGKIHTKGLLRIMLRPRFLWQRTRVWETHTMWFPWLWKPLGSGITCNVT